MDCLLLVGSRWYLGVIFGKFFLQDITVVYSGQPGNGTSLGLNPVQLNNGTVIVDTGTTEVALTSTIFNTLYNLLQSKCGQVNLVGICGVVNVQDSIFYNYFNLTSEELLAYPTINFVFSCSLGTCAPLALLPEYYLYVYKGAYTAYIGTNYQEVILGDVLMKNYHMVFDKQRSLVGYSTQETCNLNGTAIVPSSTSTSSVSVTPTVTSTVTSTASRSPISTAPSSVSVTSTVASTASRSPISAAPSSGIYTSPSPTANAYSSGPGTSTGVRLSPWLGFL